MKYLLIIGLLFGITVNAKTIKEGDVEYSCQPKKDCGEQLKDAQSEIARLKKQVKYLKEQNSQAVVPVVQTKVVEKTVTVVQKTEPKKNTLSLLGVNSRHKPKVEQSAGSTNFEFKRDVTVGLMYQRHFDNDIAVGIGADGHEDLIVSLGLDF